MGGTAGSWPVPSNGRGGPFSILRRRTRRRSETMANGVCVVCEGAVALPEGSCRGEILVCGDCGTELELVELDPPRFEEAPQVQEDWGE